MNFRIIEGDYANMDELYPLFEQDYLYSNVYADSLREKYGLTHNEFKELSDKVKTNHGLSRRPRVACKTAKYYYKSTHGFIIQKNIGRNICYIGTVCCEQVACKVVELCKKVGWDIDVCRSICKNWREHIV